MGKSTIHKSQSIIITHELTRGEYYKNSKVKSGVLMIAMAMGYDGMITVFGGEQWLVMVLADL